MNPWEHRTSNIQHPTANQWPNWKPLVVRCWMLGVGCFPSVQGFNPRNFRGILSMNHVAQPSRLRVRAASRRAKEHGAGRPANSQAGTPALQLQPRFRGSMREILRGMLSPIEAERKSAILVRDFIGEL